MHTISARYFFSMLVFLFLCTGCARPPIPAEKPRPAPFDSARLTERSNAWSGYEAKFRLKVDSQKARFSARAIVLTTGRDLVRFETFGPIGQTAALFVLGASGPSLLIPSERVLFSSQRPETLVRYFLGVTLPFETFRYALAASIPPDQLGALEGVNEAGMLHLIYNSGGRYFDWQFSETQALSGVYVRMEGFEGRVSYDPPVETAIDAAPKKIRMSSSEWSMELSLDSIRPASAFEPKVFAMPEISEIRKVDLDRIQ
ncbi:MAG: hypothetical protein LLG06_12700 [Desulfobacteraceae bacterium]|nr:hypothetical protein [Desulfobacteraceae bacterium]